MTIQPILSTTALSKMFGAVTALDNVDFELFPGEVLALLGDNGAGKSTLIKILSGYYQPSSGQITLEGRQIQLQRVVACRIDAAAVVTDREIAVVGGVVVDA